MSGISTAAAMPLELKGGDQWVPWHIEIRNGEPTKVPLNTHTGARGSCTDASTWSACEPAVAFADKEKAAGVGFVFAPDDPFCGIDLDNCLDPETREIEPWAMKIVRALDSYTETSPSGRGLHIIVRAELPPGGNRKGKVEM